MTIILYQHKPMFGLPGASPFSMKLETYLRMADLRYEVSILKGRAKSPTGKVPYIELDGKLLADSGLIIEHLERINGHPVDGRLTLAQRAESLAMQRLMEEHLYWVIVYGRTVDQTGYAHTKDYFREMLGISNFMLPIVMRLARTGMSAALRAQGIGRHGPDTIWKMGTADIQALSHWLGKREWGFGDAPGVVDACLSAFIGNIVRVPWDTPLKRATLKHTNLVSHFDRMMRRIFPDLAS